MDLGHDRPAPSVGVGTRVQGFRLFDEGLDAYLVLEMQVHRAEAVLIPGGRAEIVKQRPELRTLQY